MRRSGLVALVVSGAAALAASSAHAADMAAPSYTGKMIGIGEGDEVTARPTHPYTKRLLLASPVPDPVRQERRRDERRALLAASGESDVQAA